jgi:suppressor of ftsI
MGDTPAASSPSLRRSGSLQLAQSGPSDSGATDPNALNIPPLLSPPLQNGVRTFELTLQRGQMAFEPDRPVDTLGINGPYLGPTLRATQGDAVEFTIVNQIGEPTTLHWHGMHLPAEMDGGPHQEIAPDATWRPRFTIRQQAATLWFHSHLMGRSRDQVTRGLAGMFILDDDNPAQTELPHSYGVDDFPLILQGYVGAGGGSFGLGRGGQQSGGLTLVNGSLGPVLTTEQTRLRLRLLNASDQRIYALGFAGDLPFHQVASDGGLLPAPVRLTRLVLGPAERAEIVVDLAAAQGDAPLLLQRFGAAGLGRGGGTPGQGATLLTIHGPGERAATAAGLQPLPERLNTIERLDPTSVAVTRQMVLGGGGGRFTINGQTMTSMADMHNMANVLRVRLGDLERWNVVNASRAAHLFHVHDVQFQILDRNGAAPGPAEQGRKDTVLVRPGETVPLLMRFEEYADSGTPYMFHCHILQHEDQGMMGQLVVVSG